MSEVFAGIDPSLLTLAAIFFAMVLAFGAALAWAVFHIRADRLPAATRLADVREQVALKQSEHAQLLERIHELDQQMHDRDRLVAEVEALQRRVDEVRIEEQNLAPAREEIARVKQEAADAAQEKEVEAQRLSTLREEAERLKTELDPEHIARLTREKDAAQAELDRVRSELERLRPEMDAALRGIAEARTAEARSEALRLEAERLQAEMDRLSAAREPLAATIAEATETLSAARLARDAVEQQREAAVVDRELSERKRAKIDAEIATLETIRDRLSGEVISLDSVGGKAGEPTAEERRTMLADLVALPACLAAPTTLRGAPRTETDALHDVAKFLEECGLTFDRRTLHAFHTALKINDASQLTVLAGVSGTGKSLLPRRYAEAMGIHFLQVAVEPRWDSPQDLLGFYNYVEAKYRATELARLLAHLDPWQSLDLPGDAPERREHMALVLLDEMNLARVEYYFSEFLSRLEARPPWRRDLTPEACKDALIPVDIRGLQQPPRLFPAHNVLFVGTMNDDESTQSLSEKVLDRGNVLQFPAPGDFPQPAQGVGTPSTFAQAFREWRGWVRPAGGLEGAALTLSRDTIGKFADIMQGFGRPFGHRLNQSIRAYVANYPNEGNAGPDARVPLADQVEFRLMPKLRGVEIETHIAEFEKLEALVRDDLDDRKLAEEIERTREEQVRKTGLFVWRGLMREG